MLIGFKTQAFWLSPISSFVHTKLLQAPSGHACKGCILVTISERTGMSVSQVTDEVLYTGLIEMQEMDEL